MAEDHMRYDILAQEALRGVVRKVLAEVSRTGLPGEHHFFISFATRAPGQADATAGDEAARPAGQLPPRIAEAVRTVLDELTGDPFAAPDTERLRSLGLDARALAAAARVGLLLRVADLIVLAPGADKEAARVLARLDQPFTTSQARQALRTSRRVAIPLLEYLDRARVTERLPGDLRRLRS